MSVYREKRFHLWAVLFLLGLLIVWKPWYGLAPAVRGLPLAADTGGGRGIILEYEASIVEFQARNRDPEVAWESIKKLLDPYWGANLIEVRKEDNVVLFEVGGRLTSSYLRALLGAFGEVKSVRVGAVSLDEELVESLKKRLDPYGLGGARIRSGNGMVLVETTHRFEEVDDLLTKQGRLELFIGEQRIVGPEDILAVGKASESRGLGFFPVYFTEDGEREFNLGVRGRAGERLVAYVDRPFDAVILFENTLLQLVQNLQYDSERNLFRDLETQVPVMVVAFPTGKDRLSQEAVDYLSTHTGEKMRVIILGTPDEFSAEFLEAIPSPYTYEFLEAGVDEDADSWILRACGLLSSFPVSEELAERGLTAGSGINVPILGGFRAAKLYQKIVGEPLPVRISEATDVGLQSRAPANYVGWMSFGSVLALLVASASAGRLYRRDDFGLALLLAGGSVYIFVLGVSSLLGLAVTADVMLLLSGLFLVYLIHLIGTTRELLAGAGPGGKIKIGWKVSQIMGMLYLGAVGMGTFLMTLCLAGVELAIGTTAVFLISIVLNLFLVVPVYGRMLETLLVKEIRKEEGQV